MLYYALFVVKGKCVDVRDEYIKTVNRLIDRFEFLRRSGVYFIPCGAGSGASAQPSALQISGNPAAGEGGNTSLVILCDDDADQNSVTGKLLADILNAMKFGLDEVYVISGVNAASSGANPAAMTALVENELSKLTAMPKAVVAFGKASANALAGLATSEAPPFSGWKGAKILQAPCLEEMLENKDLKRRAWADLQAVMKEFGKGKS